MHAVRGHRTLGRDARLDEVRDRCLAGRRLDRVPLAGVLVRVRVHEHVVHLRECRHRLEQLARARQREPRRVRVADATIRGAVPALVQRGARVERRACRLEQACGHAVADVHHRLAEVRANT